MGLIPCGQIQRMAVIHWNEIGDWTLARILMRFYRLGTPALLGLYFKKIWDLGTIIFYFAFSLTVTLLSKHHDYHLHKEGLESNCRPSWTVSRSGTFMETTRDRIREIMMRVIRGLITIGWCLVTMSGPGGPGLDAGWRVSSSEH